MTGGFITYRERSKIKRLILKSYSQMGIAIYGCEDILIEQLLDTLGVYYAIRSSIAEQGLMVEDKTGVLKPNSSIKSMRDVTKSIRDTCKSLKLDTASFLTDGKSNVKGEETELGLFLRGGSAD